MGSFLVLDLLSHFIQIILTKWPLSTKVLEKNCRVIGRPMMNLFSQLGNHKLPVHLISMALKGKCLSTSMGPPSLHLLF